MFKTVTKENCKVNTKLSWLERISYGLGDYGGNLVYGAISAFLLVYYGLGVKSRYVDFTLTTKNSFVSRITAYKGVSAL